MKGKLIIASILTIFRKVIFWGIVLILLSLTVTISLLQTNYFQNWATQEVLNLVRQKTNLQVSLNGIKIRWFDAVDVYQLEILDYQGNPLIAANEAHVDYDLFHLIKENQLNFNQLELVGGSLSLSKYEDTLNINLMEFVYELSKLKRQSNDSIIRKNGRIVLNEILLSDFTFTFNNYTRDSLPQGTFDYGHFSFEIPEASMSGFSLVGDTIAVKIHEFSGLETNSKFKVDKLRADFGLSKRELILGDLHLTTPNSYITNHLSLTYNGFDDFSAFVDSVTISGHFNETYLHPDDIRYFGNLSKSFPPFEFSGDISGKVKELSIKNMTLKLRTKTYVSGKAELIGLPNLAETFMDVNVAHGYLLTDDLEEIMETLPSNIKNLGSVSFTGRFLGFLTDFVAKAEIATAEGKIVSDINLKFPSGWENAQYSGNLKLVNFSAGAFFGDKKLFQKMNFEGKIQGNGMLLTNADFYTEGKLTKTGIYGYNYQLIKAKGHFASQYFDGTLEVRDPNAMLKASGNINLKSSPETINIDAQIEKFDFFATHLSDEKLVLGTKIQVGLSGLALDSMNADVRLGAFNLAFEDQKLEMDSAVLFARNINNRRKVEFLLPEIQGKLEGDFFYSHLISDLTRVGAELKRYFQPEAGAFVSLADTTSFDEYRLGFELSFGDLSHYIDFFDQELHISEGAFVEGTYYQRKNATLSLYASVDSVNYKGSGFTKNEVDINISKDLDSLGILAVANVVSQDQYWKNMPKSTDLNVEAVWQNNNLTFNSSIEQKETNSRASINANLDFSRSDLVFSFRPSNIQVLGDRWYFNPYNKVIYNGEYLDISYLELYQNEQTILLSGIYSDSTETNLELSFKAFDISNLNTVLPVGVEGTLDGDFRAKRSVGEETFRLLSEMSILDLKVDQNHVGNVYGKSSWEAADKRLAIDFDVKRKSINTLELKGYLYPEHEDNQLDIQLDFDEANLELLDPVFEKHVSNLSGKANGSLKINGMLKSPLLNGDTRISDGFFTYDYLGVTYRFEGKLLFDDKSIKFQEVLLRDKEFNRAYLEGAIYHDGFQNMRPDIRISTTDFIFLNTNANHGEIYYGTVHASGDLYVTGSFSDLLISSKMRSEKGTKFYISLQEDNKVNQKHYITFSDLSDTTKTISVAESILNAISGVRLDFDMEITPDAYVELIFDPRAGDIIKGTGDGNLNLVLDNNGEFELFGDVNIVNGSYNFTYTLANTPIISKEFNIRPGGTISFYGDPNAGVMDIDAVYRQLASFSDYESSPTNSDQSQVSTRVPILVVLNLQGAMLSPNIGFAIQLDDNQASATPQENGAIVEINNNEDLLKRQVFSLLMLRKFSPKIQDQVQGPVSIIVSVSLFQISFLIT